MNQSSIFPQPEDEEEELGMKIDFLITKIQELETVHTSGIVIRHKKWKRCRDVALLGL